ncbi:MAG: helix-turn-helix domain-containing protein [Cyclobacteriaceae bacterium]
MQVELITRKDLEDFKEEVFQRLDSLLAKGHYSKRWLKSEDVQEMLSISPSTLQNLRQSRKIPFTRLGGVYYYPEQGIIDILEKNLTQVDYRNSVTEDIIIN